MSEWIATKSRLPEVGGTFLVTVVPRLLVGLPEVRIMQYRGDERSAHWVSNEMSPIAILVTHWMPLPAPPEAEHVPDA